MSRPSQRASFVAQAAGLCVVGWGALAFGCVYPWAYWPLATAAAMVGAAGLIVSRSRQTQSASRAFVWTLAAVAGAILMQLIPLPMRSLGALSPGAVELLNELDPAFHGGLVPLHTLSVWPRDTLVAFVLFGSFAVLLVGMAALFSTTGSRRFVDVLTVLGVVLALVGIVQKPLFSGAIYGLWPLDVWRQPFGPFVNRNHFAGWMVMVLPLTLALLVAGIAHSMSKVKTGWRHKVLWLSSPEASRL